MNSDIKNLEKSIKEAQVAYYNGSEIMSDDEYDALIYELGCLDPKNGLLTSIGAEPVLEWKKEKHLFPLGSLNKVNTPTEMADWITKTLGTRSVFVVEKLDGLSIGCQYEDGKLIKALLRGGGESGENILSNTIKMQGVVKSIPNFTGVLRGEIVLTKSDHQKYFQTYSNPRNAASGLCRRLDGEGCEHLTLMFYQVLGSDFKTEEQQFKFMEKAGCIVPNHKLCKTPQEVNDLWKQYQDKTRLSLDYEIDGLVVNCNDVAFQQSLGMTNLRPKSKLAFKFANQFIKTTITAVEWITGSMGRITPVCWFDKVNLLGSNIEKASGYNVGYLNKLGLDVGAKVLVCKAGEIIPRVEKVIESTGTVCKPPTKCPSCNENIVMDGEYLVCTNSDRCTPQVVGGIKNWVKELNILELGDGIIEKLVMSQYVSTPADLYTLTIDNLASLDRMGEKSAKNVYNSLWKNNPIMLDVFLGALSIPLIGSSSIRLLMEAGYDTLGGIESLSVQQMEAVKGMGPMRAQSLFNGLRDKSDIINQLLENGVEIKDKVVGKLTGKSCCFSGPAENKRPVLEQMVIDAGGTVKGSVGKGLSFLVLADKLSQSSKAVKARSLGTEIISEQEFLDMVS